MRRVRYVVAMSLDGYIAGPRGEADWIVMDPEIDFAELWSQFDTLLMGRRTYEAAVARLGPSAMRGMEVVVASRTLCSEDHPGIHIIPELTGDAMQKLRQHGRKDVWLMGGGELFGLLLSMQQVDTVEVSTVPVLLGSGVPLLRGGEMLLDREQRTRLRLAAHKIYRSSGIVTLAYEVQR